MTDFYLAFLLLFRCRLASGCILHAMMRYCYPTFIFLFVALGCLAQQKLWKATIYEATGKMVGLLKEVSDTSLLLATKHGFETISFSDIQRIRFVRTRDDGLDYLSGALIGSVGGAIIGVNSLTKGKAGEGSALAGIFGGIGGGIIGAVIGTVTAPIIYKWLSAKKIIMVHSPAFYGTLPQLLKPYTVL